MNEFNKSRPVSGEIITDTPGCTQKTQKGGFSDANYETLDPGHPVYSASLRFAATQTSSAGKMVAGMDLLRNRPSKAAGSQRQQGSPMFWAVGIALVVLAFWISGGYTFIRQSLLSMHGALSAPLHIVDVESRIEMHGNQEVLFVEGYAENQDSRQHVLPAITITVFAGDGSKTRYFLGTNDSRLKAGARYAFSSRLDVPRNGVETVSVAFQENND